MIQVTANLDLSSWPKIDTQHMNDLLRYMWDEPLYVIFYARKEPFKGRAWREKEASFLSIILPYEEVLKNDDNLGLMLDHLYQNVDKLKWLDHQALKRKLAALLGDEGAANTPAIQA
ncbi:MAG TPA: hypothetical protein PKA00_20770 [Saprospiraceae bacterium]|nr:hypothetical protein [Saprospiraceae bacterium]HMQ85356.1 hypothetical protein [Saprospiraceae bacterium]